MVTKSCGEWPVALLHRAVAALDRHGLVRRCPSVASSRGLLGGRGPLPDGEPSRWPWRMTWRAEIGWVVLVGYAIWPARVIMNRTPAPTSAPMRDYDHGGDGAGLLWLPR